MCLKFNKFYSQKRNIFNEIYKIMFYFFFVEMSVEIYRMGLAVGGFINH